MNILYLTIFFAFLIAVGALVAFVWAVRSGQFDDLDTPAFSILVDDLNKETIQRGDKDVST